MYAFILTFLVATPDAGVMPPVLPELRRLAVKLEPSLEAPWVKAWLSGVTELESVKPATWYCTKDKQKCVPKDPKDPAFAPRLADDEFTYARITDPLGYARPFEVLAAAGFDPKGKKVLDFGYGNLGQLLMLARLGTQVHGVEADALLPLATKAVVGKVVLHHGYFKDNAGRTATLRRMADRERELRCPC